MKLQQWAHWAEIIASLAVVVTLVFLLREVRGNTLALERESALDRATAIDAPFMANSEMASVLTKIKIVDGSEPYEQAMVERYDLTYEEAIMWGRHLALIWSGLEADYALSGESQGVEDRIQMLLSFPDNQVFWEHTGPELYSAGFQAYVDRVRDDR